MTVSTLSSHDKVMRRRAVVGFRGAIRNTTTQPCKPPTMTAHSENASPTTLPASAARGRSSSSSSG